MLSLETPALEIDGVLVFADHAVPTHFYYSAPDPKLARAGGRLMLDMYAYAVELEHSPLAGTTIPDELGAGFLNLGVECALSETTGANLRRELAERTGRDESEISMAPIPYHKGTVSVIALDAYASPADPQVPPTSAEATKGRPTFVEAVLGAGKPSLLGDLRTIFSLSLSQAGVAFLDGLFADGAMPVGVVYDLRFYGLRPAVSVEVHARLSRIYEHFGGGAGVQYQWFKADISAALDKLREQGAFTVRVTKQMPGDEAAKAEELGLSLFKDQIVQQMFRPTSPPTPAVAATLPSLIAIGTTPGTTPGATQAPQAKLAFTLEFKTTDELRDVTYSFEERAPEERSHAPQAFLGALLSPSELAEHVHRVDLDDPFFEQLEVLVTGPRQDEFEALGIRQVEARLAYGNPSDAVPPDTGTLLFRPDSTGDKTFAAKRRGRSSLAYTMARTYEFDRGHGVDSDSFRYEFAPRTLTGRTELINPLADFGVLDVELELGRLHASVQQVDVDLWYVSPVGNFSATETLRLLPAGTEAAGPAHWQVRTVETELANYLAAYAFRLTDGTVVTTRPASHDQRLLRVDDPFAGERQLRILPNVTSPDVTELVVELDYEDTANGYRRGFEIPIVKDGAGRFPSQVFSWPVIDRAVREVRYRVTTREAGFVSIGEWERTEEPSVEVGAVGSRIVTIDLRLIGPPLSELGVDAVHVRIGLPGSDDTSAVLFDGSQTALSVRLTLPPGAPLRYRYQTTSFRATGQTTKPWQDATDQLLVLATRSL